jgi:hypothetical protein
VLSWCIESCSRDAAKTIQSKCSGSLKSVRDPLKTQLLTVLVEGFGVVAHCRSVLSYSYVRMYGLKKDDTAKELFRFGLSGLEERTDSIQEQLENISSSAQSKDKLSALQLSVRSLQRLVDSFLQSSSLQQAVDDAKSSKKNDGDDDGDEEELHFSAAVAFKTPFPVADIPQHELTGGPRCVSTE